MYYTYMLRCDDNSIYTGIASDVERRMKEHFSKDKKCAKYTLTHSPKQLECVWESQDRILASKLEYYIKKLKKEQKEEIIKKHKLPQEWFEKLDVNMYQYVNLKIKNEKQKIKIEN